ncbi:MAG: hypothetical protein WKF84_14065 [Pyrinomonadaceae bacterium]
MRHMPSTLVSINVVGLLVRRVLLVRVGRVVTHLAVDAVEFINERINLTSKRAALVGDTFI